MSDPDESTKLGTVEYCSECGGVFEHHPNCSEVSD